MSRKLLITEKPSVAMEFAKALKVNTTRKLGNLSERSRIRNRKYLPCRHRRIPFPQVPQ